MFNEEDLQPQRVVHRVGDWFEQRKSFRLAALLALRKREGLPSPVDAGGNALETRMDDSGNATYHDASGARVSRVLFAGTGKDGKPGSFATGTRQQPSETFIDEEGIPRIVPTAGVLAAWSDPSEAGFDILEVAEDGRKLQDELLDLNRDAGTYAIAERVSHGEKSEQAPGFDLDGTSDEEIEARFLEYLKRGLKDV